MCYRILYIGEIYEGAMGLLQDHSFINKCPFWKETINDSSIFIIPQIYIIKGCGYFFLNICYSGMETIWILCLFRLCFQSQYMIKFWPHNQGDVLCDSQHRLWEKAECSFQIQGLIIRALWAFGLALQGNVAGGPEHPVETSKFLHSVLICSVAPGREILIFFFLKRWIYVCF